MRPLAALLAAALTACAPAGTPGPTPAPTRGPTRVVSLLANNHLLVADIGSGAILAELALGAPPALVSQVHASAVDQDGRTLFVLVSDATGRGTVAVIDATTLRVSATLDAGSGLAFRGLAIGPRTGKLYLFANDGGDAVVRVLDPTGGTPTQTWPARASAGRTWLVYQGAVAPDESALYLSYHGPDTTGIDRFEIRTNGLQRCEIPSVASSGCFGTHGAFALRDGQLIAAAGEAPWLALDPVTGVTRRQFDMRLEGNHLMEFGIAPSAGRLYAVGSCGYTGGLAAVDLASGVTRVVVPARTRGALCGERVAAVADGSLLVVAVTGLPVPTALAAGALAVVTPDGRTVRRIMTPAEPIDLLLY